MAWHEISVLVLNDILTAQMKIEHALRCCEFLANDWDLFFLELCFTTDCLSRRLANLCPDPDCEECLEYCLTRCEHNHHWELCMSCYSTYASNMPNYTPQFLPPSHYLDDGGS